MGLTLRVPSRSVLAGSVWSVGVLVGGVYSVGVLAVDINSRVF